MILGRDFLRQHRVLFVRSQKKLYISYIGGGGDVFVSHLTRIEPWLQREADEGNPDAEPARGGVPHRHAGTKRSRRGHPLVRTGG